MATQTKTGLITLQSVLGGPERYNQYKGIVQRTLPKDVTFERYWTMYLQIANEFVNLPSITDKKSVLACMMNAPKFGLVPDPVMGQIYFVPYGGKLTYQLGYKGMLELSRRSGKVIDVIVNQVFEKEEFVYYIDENGAHWKHVPMCSKEERGREICIYSIFIYSSGYRSFHKMDSYHIDEIKKMVLARTPKSPWGNALYEPEMRKKTCIRRHWKTEPWSVEVAQAIEHEEAIERGEHVSYKHEELTGFFEGNIIEGEFSEDPFNGAFDEPKPEKREPGQD